MSHHFRLPSLCALALGVAAIFFAPATNLRAEDAVAAAADAQPTAQVFELPLLVTDVGQGNNAKLVHAMLKRTAVGEENMTVKDLATVADLEGAKTLVIGVGASTKGLGAAGLDVTQEMDRANALLAAAKEKGIPVVGIHLGGDARRGELSDGFNKLVFEASSAFLLWSGGDTDGFFKNLSAANPKVQLISLEKKTAIGAELVKHLQIAAPEAE